MSRRKSTKKWFVDHDVRVLSRPASTPDLNVIEITSTLCDIGRYLCFFLF